MRTPKKNGAMGNSLQIMECYLCEGSKEDAEASHDRLPRGRKGDAEGKPS